jgi:hypothetical protein
MRAPRIAVVHDHDSTITPQLRTWNDPHRGVIVGMVRPGHRHTGWLASDLIAALGKTTGRGFNADGWAVASSHLVPWIVVEGIDHIVIGYAEVLPVHQLVAITHLASLAEVTVWFISDAGTSDNLAAFADDFGAETMGAEDFETQIRASLGRSVDEATEVDRSTFPSVVPDDTFLTFLATARKTMNESRFSEVLELYVMAFDDTQEWLATLRRVPTERDVACHVSTVVEGHATLAGVTTAMRGVQAAAFRAGLLIKLDPRRFLNRMAETRAALDLSDDEWRSLSSNGNTRQCAIAVLAALGLTVTDIHTLAAEQIAPGATAVRTDDRIYQVPPAARPLLLAQMLYRACAGDPTDPSLLAGSRKDATYSVRGVSMSIDDLARTTGIAFRAVHDRWDSDSTHWRQRTGISVAEVAA